MNALSKNSNSRLRAAFSLVEMLAAVSIIGIISFLAIPNLVRMRGESEKNLAIARCESLNMAMASFVQVRGRTQATQDWANASSTQGKYALISPYLAFSETNLTDYVPSGYTVTFGNIDPLQKVTLSSTTSGPIYY